MEITYLLNSGFIVKVGRILLIFDDFEDNTKSVGSAIEKGGFESVYIFASHAHFDHFDSHILDYESHVEKYVFGYDIRRTKRVKAFPQEKIVYMNPYEEWKDENIEVKSFDSTDAGVSFWVKAEGKTIFHAGDFNWWDWLGDTEQNRKFAENGFMKQMKRIDGMEADIAFFPVDGRLEESMSKGAREFCRRTNVKALVTMHSVGFPKWQAEDDFFESGREIPIWSPTSEGERRILDKEGEFVL